MPASTYVTSKHVTTWLTFANLPLWNKKPHVHVLISERDLKGADVRSFSPSEHTHTHT